MRYEKFVMILCMFVLLVCFAIAAITQVVFHAPANANISEDTSRLLNFSVWSSNQADGIDVIIYGNNSATVQNHSILFRHANVTNATSVTFNWTAPKLFPTDDTVLLLSFDNRTGEFADNLSFDSDMVLFYMFNNNSEVGEGHDLVYDFSSYGNNATPIGSSFFNSSGKFSGAYQFDGVFDYLDSENSTDLALSDVFSIEGWFYPFGGGQPLGNISNVSVDRYEYESDTAFETEVINVSVDVFAVLYTGESGDGYIKTYNKSYGGHINGTVNDTVIDTLEFDGNASRTPHVAHINGSVYAIAYSGDHNDGFVTTIQLFENGTLGDAAIDTFEFVDSTDVYDPQIINVTSGVVAIVYEGPGADGFTVTVNVSSNGTITKSVVASIEHDTSNGETPSAIKLTDGVYAVVYDGAGTDGNLSTYSVSNDGTTIDLIDTLEFNTAQALDPEIVHVHGDSYVIIFEEAGDDGNLTTINITENGTISNSIVSTFTYQTSDRMQDAEIVEVVDGVFALVHSGDGTSGGRDDGMMYTVNISNAGIITGSVTDSFEYQTNQGSEPSLFVMNDTVLGVVYQGSSDNTTLTTLSISDAGGITSATLGNATVQSGTDINYSGIATFPDMVSVNSNVLAVVYQGGGTDGYVKTFNVTRNGTLASRTELDFLEFDTANGQTPRIEHVWGEVYAIVYEGTGSDGYVVTLSISSQGELGSSVIDSFEYSSSDQILTPDIILVGNETPGSSMLALVHSGDGTSGGRDDGFITTVNITHNGTIQKSVVDSYEFNTTTALDSRITSVDASLFAIVYEGAGTTGLISTVRIFPNGTILDSILNTTVFDAANGETAEILSVNDTIFAIVYDGEGSDGYIKTVNITSNGSAIHVFDTFEFDASQGFTPEIIKFGDELYVIAYEDSGDDGGLVSINITDSGRIGDSIFDFGEFDSGPSADISLVRMSGDVLVVAHEGPGAGNNNGHITVVDISEGFNGVSKSGSYALYADDITAYARLHNETIRSTSVSQGWNHLALTYNRSKSSENLELFVNGLKKASLDMTDSITATKSNLLVGSNFHGLVDDVAVYNRSLTDDEVKAHAGILLIDATGRNNGTQLFTPLFGEDLLNYSGKLGGALEFNGSGRNVSVSDSSTLDLQGNFSIAFWVYPTNLSKNQTFVAKGFGTSGTNYFVDYTTNMKVEFGFYSGGAFRSIAVDGSDVSSHQWNLIVATWNETGNVSKLYINGAEKGSFQLDYDIVSNNHDLRIGSFPGFDQNYSGLFDELVIYNKTLTSLEVANIYRLQNGTWYWKFSAEDGGGLSLSATRSFDVGRIWDVIVSSFGSIGRTLNTNISLNFTINNTNENNDVNITIVDNYTGDTYYNYSFPVDLYGNSGGGGNISVIEAILTSPTIEGATPVLFNITTTHTTKSGASVPYSQPVRLTIFGSSANPLLVARYQSVPTFVSQNNSGIRLVASVENLGQGVAENVELRFVLPDGWTNSSGTLKRSVGTVSINEQNNFSIDVDISNTAASGLATLEVQVTGTNSSSVELNETYVTNGTSMVTVNSVSSADGPSLSSTSTSSGGGGGGGSGSGVALVESSYFSESLQVVRGDLDARFFVTLSPRLFNVTLENLVFSIVGYPEQYISFMPETISHVAYGERENVTIVLRAPSYSSYEEYNLTLVITGDVVRSSGERSAYVERRNIQVIIQEISFSSARQLLDDARVAIDDMVEKEFNTVQVESLFLEATQLLDSHKHTDASKLAETILSIKETAFAADDLLRRVIVANTHPREAHLITGSAIGGVQIPFNSVPLQDLLGEFNFFSSDSTREIVLLSIAALERGDYATALQRAERAQTLLLLERKGNVLLFVYLYWYVIVLGLCVFFLCSFFGYRVYRKSSITKRIEEINEEEEHIQKLVVDSQRQYFSGKTSSHAYDGLVAQHRKRLARIRKLRLQLRNKRLKILGFSKIREDLDIEVMQVEALIKKLQVAYYRDRSISGEEYTFQFSAFTDRLAEIEGERATVALLEYKKLSRRTLSSQKALEKEIARKRNSAKRIQTRSVVLLRVLGFIKNLFAGVSSKKNSSRLRKKALKKKGVGRGFT